MYVIVLLSNGNDIWDWHEPIVKGPYLSKESAEKHLEKERSTWTITNEGHLPETSNTEIENK